MKPKTKSSTFVLIVFKNNFLINSYHFLLASWLSIFRHSKKFLSSQNFQPFHRAQKGFMMYLFNLLFESMNGNHQALIQPIFLKFCRDTFINWKHANNRLNSTGFGLCIFHHLMTVYEILQIQTSFRGPMKMLIRKIGRYLIKFFGFYKISDKFLKIFIQ